MIIHGAGYAGHRGDRLDQRVRDAAAFRQGHCGGGSVSPNISGPATVRSRVGDDGNSLGVPLGQAVGTADPAKILKVAEDPHWVVVR
jgi:hypothetical protein